jgi:hypothetical protein
MVDLSPEPESGATTRNLSAAPPDGAPCRKVPNVVTQSTAANAVARRPLLLETGAAPELRDRRRRRYQ